MAHLEDTHKPSTRRQAIVTCDGIAEKLRAGDDERAAEATVQLSERIGELLEGDDD